MIERNVQVNMISMVLENMSNDKLAAANNALTGFGNLPSYNIAFDAFKNADLVKDNGHSTFNLDILLESLSREVNRRVSEGTFK